MSCGEQETLVSTYVEGKNTIHFQIVMYDNLPYIFSNEYDIWQFLIHI